MREFTTSEEKRARIIELRQKGESYSSIARDKQVNLDRRTAKKLYEAWDKEQSATETRETRLQLKRQLMADHANELDTFGRALARAFGVPEMDDEQSGEEVFRGFLESYTRQRDSQSPPVLDRDDRTLLERRNERLYRDLRAHTASTEIWPMVRDYELARDDWLDGRVELEQLVEILIKDYLSNKEESGSILAGKAGLIRRLAKGLSSAYIAAVLSSADTEPLSLSFSQLNLRDKEAVTSNSRCHVKNDRIHVEFKSADRVVTIEGADRATHAAVRNAIDNAARALVDGPKASALATKLGQPLITMMRCHDNLLKTLYAPGLKGLILDTRCDHCPM